MSELCEHGVRDLATNLPYCKDCDPHANGSPASACSAGSGSPTTEEIWRDFAACYKPDGFAVWLSLPQGMLAIGGEPRSPIQCIEDGDMEKVTQLMDQVLSGAYI